MTSLTGTAPRNGHQVASIALEAKQDWPHTAGGGGTEFADRSVRPRVALVDDEKDAHLLLNDLGGPGRFQLTSSCYSAGEALARLREERPDVVIMDIRLPDMSGIDCTGKLRAVLPELPIIMLTAYPDGRSFFRSLMEGARGFLVKPVLPEELVAAIDEVLKGQFALTKPAVPFLVQLVRQIGQVTCDKHLTPREEQVLACLFEGLADKEIASALGIGTATVHTHMNRLFDKMGVHSRHEIIARYLALT